jgi:hypothetical protein
MVGPVLGGDLMALDDKRLDLREGLRQQPDEASKPERVTEMMHRYEASGSGLGFVDSCRIAAGEDEDDR